MSKDQSMRTTEEDAKQRACPYSMGADSLWSPCIGSCCMAWRWVGKEDPNKPSEGFCGMAVQFPSR